MKKILAKRKETFLKKKITVVRTTYKICKNWPELTEIEEYWTNSDSK